MAVESRRRKTGGLGDHSDRFNKIHWTAVIAVHQQSVETSSPFASTSLLTAHPTTPTSLGRPVAAEEGLPQPLKCAATANLQEPLLVFTSSPQSKASARLRFQGTYAGKTAADGVRLTLSLKRDDMSFAVANLRMFVPQAHHIGSCLTASLQLLLKQPRNNADVPFSSIIADCNTAGIVACCGSLKPPYIESLAAVGTNRLLLLLRIVGA